MQNLLKRQGIFVHVVEEVSLRRLTDAGCFLLGQKHDFAAGVRLVVRQGGRAAHSSNNIYLSRRAGEGVMIRVKALQRSSQGDGTDA